MFKVVNHDLVYLLEAVLLFPEQRGNLAVSV